MRILLVRLCRRESPLQNRTTARNEASSSHAVSIKAFKAAVDTDYLKDER